MTHKWSRDLQRRGGFTLIELVVVVGILVILAGLLLPSVDVYKLKANKGVAAANMTDISRGVQQFYAQNNVYPDRWDSLLSGTSLWVPGPPGTTPGLDPQLVGGPPAGSPHKLTTTQLTENGTVHEVRSLTRMGITSVLDLDASDSLPGNRFTVVRALIDGATVATVNIADDDGLAIVHHFYPQADPPVIPPDKKLVVFGLGPTNGMVGRAMQETPFYSNTDSTQYYNRYLVIFEVDGGGSRARLLGVVGGDADRIDEEIADYFER